MSLGNAIKVLRTRAGYKQSDFSVKINCSQNYLSLIENEKRAPSLTLMRRISEVLNIPLELLLISDYTPSTDASLEETRIVSKIKELAFDLYVLKLEIDLKFDETGTETKD